MNDDTMTMIFCDSLIDELKQLRDDARHIETNDDDARHVQHNAISHINDIVEFFEHALTREMCATFVENMYDRIENATIAYANNDAQHDANDDDTMRFAIDSFLHHDDIDDEHN